MVDRLTRPQIRDRLTEFVARWSQRPGDEKSEAPFPPLAPPEEPQSERLFVPEGELL